MWLSWRNRSIVTAVLAAMCGCAGWEPPAVSTGGARPKEGEPPAREQSATPKDPHNLIANAGFDGSISVPWTSSFTAPGGGKASVKDGEFCLLVTNQGKNPWDAQVRHREMTIQKGHAYQVEFDAHATRPTKVRSKVGMAGPPYAEYWHDELALGTERRTYRGEFRMTADDDATAELAMHVGGTLASGGGSFTVCIDNVKLVDPDFQRKDEAKNAPPPDVRVNQLGYLPGLPKRATVRSDAAAPLDWELVSDAGARVASGKTAVFGDDAASGERVHVVDFSSFRKPGKGYTLRVDKSQSHPFDIAPDLYRRPKYDALAYFYHNRSGIPIAMPYAGAETWTRPAGHETDASVRCAPGAGCSYALDVHGGWYDAGDHGKYAVNGGISVWTLLDLYERFKEKGSVADFGDGKLAIPERSNGVPDLLDEARWEIEFLLRMQVPDGAPRAGMAHHKIHDKEWTGLATAPHEDKVDRFLYPPSTAATLNLAAAAAQAARVFQPIDRAFSARCLVAAEKAWSAAQANPPVYAPASPSVGGGPYDDTNVGDEFYWAASELFVTTGKKIYLDHLLRSPFHATVPRSSGSANSAGASAMSWQSTQALGTITLALVPNRLPAAEVAAMRKSIQSAADDVVATMAKQGYGVAMRPTGGTYPWGSNSLVVNNLIVVALAYDFTNDARYLGAVAEGVDYLFGRNPLAQSYVTGYGAKAVQNPHHRFWAHQANAKYPRPPPGALAGGPNSGLQDPYAQGAGLAGCAPEKCYVDHIESWSTNEVAINWNAPLAWVLAFLDAAR
jgi:endoglucanase